MRLRRYVVPAGYGALAEVPRTREDGALTKAIPFRFRQLKLLLAPDALAVRLKRRKLTN